MGLLPGLELTKLHTHRGDVVPFLEVYHEPEGEPLVGLELDRHQLEVKFEHIDHQDHQQAGVSFHLRDELDASDLSEADLEHEQQCEDDDEFVGRERQPVIRPESRVLSAHMKKAGDHAQPEAQSECQRA